MLTKWFFRFRWIWHVIFWALSAMFLYYFISVQVGPETSSWFVILLFPITIATTYFFTHFLIPVYLNRKKYFKFFLYAAYTIILSVYLTLVVIFIIFIFITKLNVQSAYFNATFLIIGIYIPVIAGIAIRLFRILQESEENNLRLLQQKTEAELKFLKSQIEPHFLFNTLNNIYSLTLDKSDKAPEVILQLSELLSYIIYDCSQVTVPLEKELEQLENYISLEQLRYDNRVTITKEGISDPVNINIMPLIFLPLMENCFKHGVKASARQSWIKYSVQLAGERLVVSVINSIPAGKEKENSGGIGIENLKNRLQTFYGNEYKFESKATDTEYTVLLEIPKKR